MKSLIETQNQFDGVDSRVPMVLEFLLALLDFPTIRTKHKILDKKYYAFYITK